MKQICEQDPFLNWKSTVLTSTRRVDARKEERPIIRNQRWNWFGDDTELFHDRTTGGSLALQTIDQERRIRQNHTTIVKDEYKIEDLMDQLRHRSHRSPHKVFLQDLFLEAA